MVSKILTQFFFPKQKGDAHPTIPCNYPVAAAKRTEET